MQIYPPKHKMKLLTCLDVNKFDVERIYNKNVMIVGEHDAGKTTLLKKIAKHYLDNSKSVIVLDSLTQHPNKSIINSFKKEKLKDSYLENKLINSIKDLKENENKIVFMDLSKILEASNKKNIKPSLKNLLRRKHVENSSNTLISVLNTIKEAHADAVIVSDELDYDPKLLFSLLRKTRTRIIMIPNEFATKPSIFDVVIKVGS